MNAVVPFQPQQAVAPTFTMSDMERVALAIAKGGLFGSTDPNAVLTLCLVAQAEGKHPGLVMQQYHIINGKPAKKAEAMLVDFIAAGGKVEWHQLDDECADATFSHPQGGSARITWDKARVVQAQLGGNAMHKKYPRQMLRSRVVSEGVRTVFPGATSGLYVPEEVVDFDEPRRTPPTPVAQRARDLTPHQPEQIEHVEAVEESQPTIDANAGRKKAEAWANDHLTAIRAATDAASLADVQNAGAKAVAKLQREHADLFELIGNATRHKLESFGTVAVEDADYGEQGDEA